MNNGKPEAIWATKVDKAGPITPRGVKRTKIKSNATLMVVEIIKKINEKEIEIESENLTY